MSEYSYQLNTRRGLTGPSTGTCQLASFDRISDTSEISPESYALYDELRSDFVAACPKDADSNFVPTDITVRYRALRMQYYSELGVETPRNIIHRRAETEEDLSGVLGRLSNGGFRICVYLNTGGLHAVGLTPIGDGVYEAKSTWTPFLDDQQVSVTDIFNFLAKIPRKRKREYSANSTVKSCNIVAIPADRRS